MNDGVVPVEDEMPRRPVLPTVWVQYVRGEGIQMSLDEKTQDGDGDTDGNGTGESVGMEKESESKDVMTEGETTVSHVSLSDQFGRMTTSSERSRSITESKSESR